MARQRALAALGADLRRPQSQLGKNVYPALAHLHHMLGGAHRLLAHTVEGPDGDAAGRRATQPPAAPPRVLDVSWRRAVQSRLASHAAVRQQGHSGGAAHILGQQGTGVSIPQPPGMRGVRGLIEPALR